MANLQFNYGLKNKDFEIAIKVLNEPILLSDFQR